MRNLVAFGFAAALLGSACAARAEEIESGLEVGQSVGFFEVVKCGGADDGISVGQQLCYR